MSLKIIFMGTPNFAVPILETIHKSEHKILSVYTQPPKKKSRGQKILPSSIQKCAEKLKIPIRCPDSLKKSDELNILKKLKPDVVVVVAYGQIIPKNFLDLSETLFINIHASILPQWRGAAPIQRAIMNMDKETGVSIMKIENDLDAGPVMRLKKIKITDECNYENLSKRMSLLASSEIIEALKDIENNKEKFLPQDHSKATYAKKIEKIESQIQWNDKAKKIVAKINALHPSPGSWFKLNDSRVKILRAQVSQKSGKPGEIIDENLTIGCSDMSVQILELQKEGRKSMSVNDFIKGHVLKIGTILNES